MKTGRSIFSYSKAGKKGYSLPGLDVHGKPVKDLIPYNLFRTDKAPLPEVAEGEVVRHYVSLSALNYNIDYGFYPLGSCTMKYNPKINENISRLPGFADLHPLQPATTVQGALKVLKEMEKYLCAISGMERFTFQPAAGAHGELTGLMLIKAYHENNGELRKKVIIPDSAHGTNPATVAMCGYEVVEIKSDLEGGVDLPSLRAVLDGDVAGLMLTNPNTLGLYDRNIEKISKLIHDIGGLLYYDGANANAILGYSRPGDMGFDIVHFNLHKTFATPHGGGGPGSGPVGVKKELIPFLPVPLVAEKDGFYYHDFDYPLSIGQVRSFYGNFGVVLKAYAYIRTMGPDGLKRASEDAVLNANYLMKKLAGNYELPYKRYCMHEFVLSAIRQKRDYGITARDIAKALLDFGIHPPTVYFPLVVEEALMIEPTETESKEILDFFINVMEEISRQAEEEPDKLKKTPYTTPVRRLDETTAARRPILKWSHEIDYGN